MTALTDFREKFPQYGNLSDMVVAGKMYDGFYKGKIAPSDYEQKIGVPAGTIEKYERYSGVLGTAGAVGRGLVASSLGAISSPTPIDQNYGLAKSQGGVPYSGTETFEKILPKRELGEIHPTAQSVGEIIPQVAVPLMTPVPSAVGAATKGAVLGSKVGRYLPGAMTRAAKTVEKVGPVSDIKMSRLGDSMVSKLRGTFDRLVAERENAMKNVTEQDPEIRRKAFHAASKDINQFAQHNALGKIIAGNLSPYSDVEKVAHSSLPAQAFKDAQRVRDLKQLLGGDEKQVEKYAGEYAATHLENEISKVKPPIGMPRLPGSTIAKMAKAAEKWANDNSGWLDETPVTKASVQFSVDQLKAAAKAASNNRAAAVGGAALAALYELGTNAGYWIRYAASKL